MVSNPRFDPHLVVDGVFLVCVVGWAEVDRLSLCNGSQD